MNFFWIIFFLGCTGVTFLVGDVWSTLNPWKILVEGYEKLASKEVKGLFQYPKNLGFWFAYIFYCGFLWCELVAHAEPFLLSVWLSLYSIVTFIGVLFFGKKNWFEYGDLFSVFFTLISCHFQNKSKTFLHFQTGTHNKSKHF